MIGHCPTWVGWVVTGIALPGMFVAVQVLGRLRQQAREGGDALGLVQAMAARAWLLVLALAAITGIGLALVLGGSRWVLALLGGAAAGMLVGTALSLRRGMDRLDGVAQAMRDNARQGRNREGDHPWRS